ncbi:MAG: hypothetical protein RR626_08640, partial [Anaerovoracaceae bacterium]
WRKKALHMEYFKKSVWVFLLLSIANSLVKLVNPIREATWGKIFGTDFPKHDFLIEIFQNSFALHITIFDLLVSWILMGILAYGTWQVAGRKKIFKAF